MIKMNETKICFKTTFLFVFIGFTGCIKAPQPKASSVNVTNSEVLDDTDVLPVVRLGNDCTATFFKPNLAVTSAPCAQKHNSFTSASGQIHPIKAKIFHPFYKASQPLGPTNIAILQIESRFLPRYPGSPQLAFMEVSWARAQGALGLRAPFEMVGFGCQNQDQPQARGLKRRGKNVFLQKSHLPKGILVAEGLPWSTVKYHGVTNPYSIGCTGDEGAPAIINGELVGVYVGQRAVGGDRVKEAIFVDLTEAMNRSFLTHWQNYTPCKR